MRNRNDKHGKVSPLQIFKCEVKSSPCYSTYCIVPQKCILNTIFNILSQLLFYYYFSHGFQLPIKYIILTIEGLRVLLDQQFIEYFKSNFPPSQVPKVLSSFSYNATPLPLCCCISPLSPTPAFCSPPLSPWLRAR